MDRKLLNVQLPVRLITSCALLCGLVASVRASTPQLSVILPRGVQRGTEADIDLQGSRLADVKEILIYSPGITVTQLESKDGKSVHAHLRIEKDARIGEYQARVRTETGISELRTFYVTPFPVVQFKEGKPDARGKVFYDMEHAQDIEPNVTVTGSVANEQAQYFAMTMKKGQRLTAEVHGMRLGESFDPYISIMDEKRFELAVSDDTALAMQDPIASTIIPADGRYIITLRESSYGQGAHYLLHVGTFPRPTMVYPLGGKPGEDLRVKFIGNGDSIEQSIKLPDKPTDRFEIFPEHDGLSAPSPNHLRVSDMPNVMEQEPNDDQKSATAYDGELPVAFNGIIEKPADIDYFRFKAKKGEQLDIRVYARALRSPLDSVLTLYSSKGNQLANNDDSGGPDSYIRFNCGEDGEYIIAVNDQLHQGGPDYAYRVEITQARHELVFTIPEYAQNSQERWAVPIPRGNRYATLMRASRVNFGGEVSLVIPDLPEGVTMQAPNPGDGSDLVPVLFEAKADAPIAAKLCELTGKSADEKQKLDVEGHYMQKVDLVYGNNNSSLYQTHVDTLAVGVTKEAPFKLHLEQPKVPLVQGGSMQMKVKAERTDGFKGNIQVRLLFTPPNIGALSAVDMQGDKSEVDYPLNAQGNAALKTWKICMVGMADVNGQLWVASELVDLTIAAPYVLANSHITAVEQGKTGSVVFKLDQKLPFEGKAKAKLLGLPANVTAEETEISSADATVSFPVTIGDKSPVGNHNSLYCAVTIIKDGEPIVHNIGQGATLRIDKPEVPKTNQPAPVASAKNDKAAPKPAAGATLSRLEKLRQDQEKK